MDTPLNTISKIIQPKATADFKLLFSVNKEQFERICYAKMPDSVKQFTVGSFIRLAADKTISMPAIVIQDHAVSESAHLRSIRYLNEHYIQTLHTKELVFLENEALVIAWCRD